MHYALWVQVLASSFSVLTPSAPASSVKMAWRDVTSCMVCMAEQNSRTQLDLVVISMLVNSVSVSCGIPTTMPYVAICAVDADLLAKVELVVDHLE